MTWKTRKERQDEKGTAPPQSSEDSAQLSKTDANILQESTASHDPFVFDLSGNAFKPVSAQPAPPISTLAEPETPQTEMLEIDAAPAMPFHDVAADEASPEAALTDADLAEADLTENASSTSEIEPPLSMPTLAAEDDFTPMPIQAAVLPSADAPGEEPVLAMPVLDDLSSTEISPIDQEEQNAELPTFAESEPVQETKDAVFEEPISTFEEPVPTIFADVEPEPAVTNEDSQLIEPMSVADEIPAAMTEGSDDASPPQPSVLPVLEMPEDVMPVSSILDARETVTPGLMYKHTEDGIPRVAPFIVDIPPPAPIVQPAAPTLVVKFGKFTADFPLSRDVTTLGRPDSTTQTYPDIEIELDDTISRRHAEVVRRGNEYFVVDVGSANGTKLNGEVLEAYQEMKIERGDRIHLGERTEIVVQ